MNHNQPAIQVLHYNEPLPLEGDWREIRISDCPMGCKILEDMHTGQQVLAHCSNYNCYR